MAFVKMLWELSPTPIAVGSWDYWSSQISTIMTVHNSEYSIKKTTNKIAYFAYVKCTNDYTPLLISTDFDAVVFELYSRTSGKIGIQYGRSTLVDDQGITWHYVYIDGSMTVPWQDVEPYDCNLFEKTYTRDATGMAEAAQDLLDRIYAVPFSSEVVAQTTPQITTFADLRKAIRKAYGTYLFMNVATYSSSVPYRTASDNADTIIDYLVNQYPSTTYSYGAAIRITEWNDGTRHMFSCGVLGATYNYFTTPLYSKQTAYGFDYFSTTTYISKRRYSAVIESDGTISYSSYTDDFEPYLGLFIIENSGNTIYESESSNIGINL